MAEDTLIPVAAGAAAAGGVGTIDASRNANQEAEAVIDPEAALRKMYNRRELGTYAWGAAIGLLLAQTGLATYQFMYPRFRAGEFGGKFFVSQETLPSHEAAPEGYTDGKFWLVETEEGETKAIYMVCTHLGCLYKWEPANWRFECPCHGSKFTHDGFYIEGPAPRSLDHFIVSDNGDGQLAVDTGSKNIGPPAAESPARIVKE